MNVSRSLRHASDAFTLVSAKYEQSCNGTFRFEIQVLHHSLFKGRTLRSYLDVPLSNVDRSFNHTRFIVQVLKDSQGAEG